MTATTADVGKLVEDIARSAEHGDYVRLRDQWQHLYDTLKLGRPISDEEAFRLIEALDAAGTFDQLAGDVSMEARTAVDQALAAAKAGDAETLEAAVDALKAYLAQSALPLRRTDVDQLMNRLRSQRAFTAMTEIAEPLIARGQDHAELRRQYAQALIEMGRIAPALAILDQVASSKGTDISERRQALGLIGRANKQTYVSAAAHGPAGPMAVEALRRSIDAYRRGVDPRAIADSAWHGINLVAVLKRAERDRIALPGLAGEADRLAQRLVEALTQRAETSSDPWDMATLAEAHLARGNVAAAAHWFGRYGDHGKVDAFALAGTVRQLEEVWGLTVDATPQGQMLAALKTKLLNERGGEITLSTRECATILTATPLPESPIAQSILGAAGPMRYQSLCIAMQRPPAIARISRGNGLAEGTGFLVDPNQLSPRLAARHRGELLLLTNTHVVSAAPHPTAMTPEEARVGFDSGPPDRIYRCRTVWESPQTDLDAALLALDPPIRATDVRPCPLAEDHVFDTLRARAEDEVRRDTRIVSSHVFVIGHPLGQPLTISLTDTEVLDKGRHPGQTAELLHYRTPTMKGHSGSPVFDDTHWHVVALHHAGAELGLIRRLSDPARRHKANEGVAIKSIRARIVADFRTRRRMF